MHAQDAVVTLGADETALLAVVRSQILVIVDAGRELKPLAQGGPIQVAGEIDPLATVGAPCLPPKGFRDADGEQFLF